jgi:glycosyltransferase involved in cell wall biosynthesis
MVKHCKSLGFNTTVFTTFSKYREEKNDDWLTELAGNDFELVTLKSLNQKHTRKFKIGDQGLRFIPFLFFRLIRECRKQQPDFIIYPVPPWYLLIIAPIIKKITGVKYALDFIDPWVSNDIKNHIGFKKNFTQWIARKLEGWVTKHASFIYAVSQQINVDLLGRHSNLKNHIFKAIPYGVEISDFDSLKLKTKKNKLTFNYIGAVWPASFPVVSEILAAFKTISIHHKIKVNFTGTSYAGEGLAKSSLANFINKLDLSDIISEDPNRVTYKEAVELTNSADILFLFGDMSKQYAASKLMGLVASQKPFFAFLHKASFPYQFLKSVNYKYLVGYSDLESELPTKKKDNLATLINELINELDNFAPISLSNEKFKAHTAFGMTKNILTPIKEIIENDKSLR